MTGPRPAYVWKRGDAAADLLGVASAALSSSSMVFKAQGNASYASTLLQHAVQLYNWAAESPAGREWGNGRGTSKLPLILRPNCTLAFH